ncbi:MAG TPA: helix-hairpin-helix domain-containing protein [Gemmatimonadales bacterium]|jgi:competence ComEA-like helix-hairpin-helix protein|nr:helix-hairpin-helix domain-containing protein [Gemmatimonadales bacterium]
MPPERRAALLLLGLAVAGQAVRSWILAPGAPPGEVRLPRADPSASPRAHRDSAVRLTRPLAPGERIDLDRASALEIARLPRVGLTLAKAIVADRTARGPFGSLAALDRVPGIGPGLLRAIEDRVTFSAPAASGATGPLGGTVPGRRGPPLDLNSATAAQLEALPFIGPSMARRIVAWREKHGPFPAVDSLVRVPGVGPATVARVRDRVTVR